MKTIPDVPSRPLRAVLPAAKAEASRCLFCFDAPCRLDCPAGIDVPAFIRDLMHGNPRGACQLIRRENPLSWICGVLCPTGRLCASRCPRRLMDRAIDIGGLQAGASEKDWSLPLSHKGERGVKTVGKRVAVVGSGPAGLTAALCLSREGITVDLFEVEEIPGGLITYGIRPGKMDKKRALCEIGNLLDSPRISLHVETRVEDPRDLLKDYGAVFVATGLAMERIDEHFASFRNVRPATAFLKEVNERSLNGRPLRKRSGGEVLVIGGGNTAVDAALAARLAGAPSVTIAYRRTEGEMPAWGHELEEARRQGVQLRFLLEPVDVEGRAGKVHRVILRPTRLGRPGPDGRRRVLAGKGPEVAMNADLVILATGRPKETPAWMTGEGVDPATGRVGESPIWIGGELRHGVGLIVGAVADGKRAAREIALEVAGR
jgi:dihydropyrimidine dehydrogenase (NAD+) subunit PreT